MSEDNTQEGFTGPESRIMQHAHGGFEQSYNGFTAVDGHRQIIVAAELSNCATDSGHLPVMLEAVVATTEELPAQVLADAGFHSESVLAELRESAWDVIVALGREGRA